MVPGYSRLHDRLHPLPKAEAAKFSIALAHLQNDDGQNMEGFVALALKNFEKPLGVQFLQFDRTIALKDQSDDSEKAGHEKAREYLKESGAQALIWGTVWTTGGKSDAQLYYTTSATGVRSEQAYQPEDFKLPVVHRQELTDVLGMVVATQSAGFAAQKGSAVADQLKPFIDRVQLLLNGTAGQDWNPETRAAMEFVFGNALDTFGEQKGEAEPLNDAVTAYREALKEWTRERVPLYWAGTQNNLGNALETLGEREPGTTRLEEAVTAYREALKERTRERVPLYWAMMQNNLGNALRSLGERESGTTHLEEAVTAFHEALEEQTRERVPLDWADTQNNLGNALTRLGEREPGAVRLEEAVAAFREALKERTRERVPLDWATTQNNLGGALETLGEREAGTTRLEEAVAAFREALEEWTRKRVPLDWATAQNNLGAALERLGERQAGTTRLEEAVVACREALKERTRERVPFDWAMTQNNLGTALRSLGERESGTTRLEEAVAAFREALKEWTRERVPLNWASAQNKLGNALGSLGERERNVAPVCDGLGCHVDAWGVFSGAAPYYASGAANGARKDIAILEKLDPSARSQCLAKYAAALKRMGLASGN